MTSNFSKWAYHRSIVERQPLFDEQARAVLLNLQGLWENFKSELSHISKSGNAGENLMKVLRAATYRLPTTITAWVTATTICAISNSSSWAENILAIVLAAMFEGFAGRQFLKNFGYQTQRADGTPKPIPLLFQLIYQHYQTRLDNQNLIDNLPLSEERGIKPYDEGTGKNYINWLLDNSSDVSKLEHEDFGSGVAKPNALLY